MWDGPAPVDSAWEAEGEREVELDTPTGCVVIRAFSPEIAGDFQVPRPGVYEGRVSWKGRQAADDQQSSLRSQLATLEGQTNSPAARRDARPACLRGLGQPAGRGPGLPGERIAPDPHGTTGTALLYPRADAPGRWKSSLGGPLLWPAEGRTSSTSAVIRGAAGAGPDARSAHVMVTTEYLSLAELSHWTWTRQRTGWPVAVSPLAAMAPDGSDRVL